MSIILGIDPGTAVTGYGIVSYSSGKLQLLDFGCIRPSQKLSAPEKYLLIYEAMHTLIDRFHPDTLAIETQFVYKNAQSALKLGMAKGAVLIAAAKKGLAIHEYAPKQAKLAVVGNGSASKGQVQKMIQLLLHLSSLPEPEDAADALALAICHTHRVKTYV